MFGRLVLLAIGLGLFFSPRAHAQRMMEKLGRGVVVVHPTSTSAYIGWRMLGTDPGDIAFNLYRVTGGVTNLLNGSPMTASCNFTDNTADFTQANSYFVRPVLNSVEQPASVAFTLPANAPVRQYLSIPITPPPGGTSPASADGTDPGGPYTYNANDCSVGDVDGDGEYEIILKWDPSNSHDNSQSGFTGDTYLDAYKLDGTLLWRIDLGPNIRSGAHYMDFMVYDFDGDGKAEVMCRTAPGSKDGLGNYVGGVAKWQNANGPHPTFNDTDDYRTTCPNGTNGYVLGGPEFLTVFNGLTGGEMATATYYPKRDQDLNDDNPSATRINTIWGDSYGNRIDRFLAGVGYFDGKMPSALFCRGYYTRTFLVAWDWRDGQLTRRWVFDSNDGNPANLAYRGQGAHSLTIGDVDGDGKDEIIYGACAIDHDGKGLYSTGLGHGDALHLSDMDPNRPGLEVWMVHESPSVYGPTGLEYRDARTGALIFGLDGQNADVGRGVAIDIDPRYPGYEMWGARGGLMAGNGVQITANRPGQMNFACWWDADLLREILDGTTISKWDWNANTANTLLSPAGLASNNGTKSTPCLSADILGDWREEVIWRSAANNELRIYTTTIPSTNRFYTLMHDPQYRCAIAWQNTGYNQPPHPGFNIGPDMYPQPLSPMCDAMLVWRGGGNNAWNAGVTANWVTNGIWTSTNPVVTFNSGNSVLFDISGSNDSAISISSAIAPGKVTVFSPKDYAFSGNGSLTGTSGLVKAGQGTLTINTTNTFTGATVVSGGGLMVNGSLDGSAVTVERRGTPEGPSRVGGNGRFGQGLTVQRGCGVIVGPGTNAAGTLTISNALIELGALNQFDLSSDPTGTIRTNDRINVVGNLSLTGTNIIAVTQLNGFLGGGVYPLISYTGILTGGLTNLALSGDFIQPVALTNPPGMIALVAVIPAAPPAPPSGLVATAIGAFQINLAWTDNSADENAFLIQRSTDSANFAQIASVGPNTTSYQDIGLSAKTTYYYRIYGTNLAGASPYSNTNSATTTATPPSLIWRGDGVANTWDIATTANWRNGGGAAFYADGSFVTFESTGSNTPSINLAAAVQPGSVTVNATKSYTFAGSGSITGATSMVKSGSGTLTVNITNYYTGGTIISNGTVILGNAGANSSALGSGPITFDGGTLEFTGFSGSTSPEYGGNSNPLIVPAGQSGTIHVPQRFTVPGLSGTLTGGGTLNLVVNYVRGDISGNWGGFGGHIFVSNSGSDVDDFRVVNAAGFPNAQLAVGNNILMYSRATAGATIPIGEFSASSGATISAGGGSSAGTQSAVTWRVGHLNTDATNAAFFTGTTSLIKEGSGRWTLTSTNNYSGTTTVSAGTLLIDGNQSAAVGPVSVAATGTLGGSGIIGGPVSVSGALAPGDSIGTLTFAGNLTLLPGSTSLFELSRAPLTNDLASVAGTLTYGGTLDVVNVTPEPPIAGDRFKLFNAPAYNGSFSSFSLPDLDDGLAWNASKLSVDGRIWVVRSTPPAIASCGRGSGTLVFNGTGGTPDWDYYILSSTNLSLPLSVWDHVATNQFDGSGNFSCTNAVDPSVSRRFYLIELP
jgi:rhamnogalacturonan endolyase